MIPVRGVVEIPLHPSRSLKAALFLAHVLAVIAVAESGFPSAAVLFFGLVATASLLRHLRAGRFCALKLHPDGRLELKAHYKQAQDEWIPAGLLAGATSLPWLAVMRLRLPEGQTQSLILPRDAVGSEGHRRLRLWLRWQAKPCDVAA